MNDGCLCIIPKYRGEGGEPVGGDDAGARLVGMDVVIDRTGPPVESLSGIDETKVRWIVDDALKFVLREQRRGNGYEGILMDPPSYGRGPGGEVWKLEDNLWPFVALCAKVLSDKPLFVILNSRIPVSGSSSSEKLESSTEV